MQKKIKFIISGIVGLALSGCVGAMPNYNSSNSNMIIFKTPTIRYADQGFISQASSETKLEIYGNGQAVMRLRVTPTQTCLSSLKCMSNSEFNKKVLNANYPEDTLRNILNAQPIFGGKNLVKRANGFSQKIGTINYTVSDGNINFRDSSAGVKIKISKI